MKPAAMQYIDNVDNASSSDHLVYLNRAAAPDFGSVIAKMPGAAALALSPSLRKPMIDYYLRRQGNTLLTSGVDADRELTVNALLEATLDKTRVRAVLDHAPADRRRRRAAQGIRMDSSEPHPTGHAAKHQPSAGTSYSEEEVMRWLFSYGGNRADPALAERYHGLARLPSGTLGRAFWEKCQQSNYGFPGEPTGMNEAFTTRHDCTHILSGYDTTVTGEVLASIFTLSMHPLTSAEARILLSMFDWDLGRRIRDVTAPAIDALDPRQVWHAWARGGAAKDLFGPDWRFWDCAATKIADLQTIYGIKPRSRWLSASRAGPLIQYFGLILWRPRARKAY
jgi:hypothetical protein